MELSVTSIVSRSAGTWAAARLTASHEGRLRSASSRAERLTATPSWGCASRTVLRVASDASTENRVSPAIMPVFSAMGMNMSGMIRPCSGWFQRIRASNPTGSPVCASTWGW